MYLLILDLLWLSLLLLSLWVSLLDQRLAHVQVGRVLDSVAGQSVDTAQSGSKVVQTVNDLLWYNSWTAHGQFDLSLDTADSVVWLAWNGQNLAIIDSVDKNVHFILKVLLNSSNLNELNIYE